MVSSLEAGDKDPGGLVGNPDQENRWVALDSGRGGWRGSRSSHPGSPSRVRAGLSLVAGADLSPGAGADLFQRVGTHMRFPQGGAELRPAYRAQHG